MKKSLPSSSSGSLSKVKQKTTLKKNTTFNMSTSSNVPSIHIPPINQPLLSVCNNTRIKTKKTNEGKATSRSMKLNRPAVNSGNEKIGQEKSAETLSSEDEYKLMLQDECSSNDQEMFLGLTENKCALKNIDESLATLQRRIAKNQEILRQTKENIKKINKNPEMEYLLNLKVDFEKISGVRKKDLLKTNKRNEAVVIELEKMRDNIARKNIPIPETGPVLESFNTAMKETLSTYENLSKHSKYELDESNEISNLMQKYQMEHKKIDQLEKSLSDELMPKENSLATNEIDSDY